MQKLNEAYPQEAANDAGSKLGRRTQPTAAGQDDEWTAIKRLVEFYGLTGASIAGGSLDEATSTEIFLGDDENV